MKAQSRPSIFTGNIFKSIPYDQHFTHTSLPIPKARDVGVYVADYSLEERQPMMIYELPPRLVFQVSPATVLPCHAKCNL